MPVKKFRELDETLVRQKEAAFADFIQRKGLKTTRQRNTIISTFFRLRGHISVEELLNQVKQANPRIGYATVYRTLHLLVESGLVEERRFGDGLARYEGHSDVEHHDHMICRTCGRIVEFVDERLERMKVAVAEQHGFRLISHELKLFVECQDPACAHRPRVTRPAEAQADV